MSEELTSWLYVPSQSLPYNVATLSEVVPWRIFEVKKLATQNTA